MLVVADADADAHLHRLVIDHEGGLHGLADHGGDLLCLTDIVARQQQDELVPCQAGKIALVAEELRLAQESLSEITGEFSSDDLLGRIFSSFCIGK